MRVATLEFLVGPTNRVAGVSALDYAFARFRALVATRLPLYSPTRALVISWRQRRGRASVRFMAATQVTVDPLSFVSLLLQLRCKGLPLANATGFVVSKDGRDYLITNWHVLAGRHPETNKPLSDTAAVPDELVVCYHTTVVENGQRRTGWRPVREPLNDAAGNPRWLAHPDGSKVDVGALQVSKPDDQITLYQLDLALANTNLFAGVGETVSIIGYPFGLTGGALFPIWKAGHIASEPEVDYGDMPVFLVDATTRDGMSGSPVVRRFAGFGYRIRSGFEMIGSSTLSAGSSALTRFTGVYAGRIGRIKESAEEAVKESAEIGRVWKPQVIDQLLEAIPSP
jgi:hypothetical protein